MPVRSAKNHPITIDTQIPTTPINDDNIYASTTLVPKEIIVNNKLIPGFDRALNNPYSKKR